MKIKALIQKDVMILSLKATNKADAITEMVQKLVDTGYVTDFDTFKSGVLAREGLTSTGLGDGIAMPHSKSAAVKEAVVLFAKKEGGLDYESLDGKLTDLFFMIVAPEGANDTHLATLAELSKYLMTDGFADSLRSQTTSEEVLSVFDAIDNQRNKEDEKQVENHSPFIIAVTACATGIAHTYMAEEALKKQAKEMGVHIKVETNGASGVGNPLTAADIKRAKGVIIAADKAVDMDRFDGKHLISKPVAAGIRQPKNLINMIIKEEAGIFRGSGVKTSEDTLSTSDSIGLSIYKNLMNSVSHMLPFIVAGGVLVAISFLFGIYSADPKSNQYNQFAATLKEVGGYAMGMMVPVLSAFIAEGISNRTGFVVGFVGGLVANGAGAGFLGGIVSGFLAGYTVLILIKLLKPLPKEFEGLKAIFLYPVLGVFITGFLMSLASGPMKAINEGMMVFLKRI